MIINAIDKNNEFLLRWRDKEGKREEKRIPYATFKPYFYILASESEKQFMMINEYGQKYRIDLFYEVDGSVSLDGQLLKKVSWNPPRPGYTRTIRNEWPQTWEADVPFHYRYAVDELTKIPEYELKKWYWDLEWQQGGEHDGAITCISCYTDKEHGILYWLPTLECETWDETSGGFASERNMLLHFLRQINERDPDMLISWFKIRFA